MAATALDMAKTVLGRTEGRDRQALIDYMKTGGQNIDPQTRAWCASFINASLNQAGYSGTGSDLARSFLEWGNAVDPGQVQAGDIGVYPRGADPMYGHAGIVESVDPKTGMVTMVSGNAGPQGAVTESQYALNQALGFRRADDAQRLDAQMKAQGYTPEQRRNAIASIESKGAGDYGALGAWTGDPQEGRDRAYGRYQVMGSNIGPWAEQYLKQSGVTSEQFMADPALQDKLFDAVYGDYVSKYGERGAASKWFTGSEKEPERSDVHGKLTGRTYADKYMAALGAPAGGDSPSEGGSRFGGTGLGTPAANPYELLAKKDKKKNALETFGEGIGDAAAAMAKTQFGYNVPATPGAARVDLQPVSSIDPQRAEQQRQMLAAAMTRLNSGNLF